MLFDSSKRDAVAFERLSALVDGELDGDAAAQACGDWRENGEARASWHAYHLIGDVLRSDDLARDPARDLGFLAALRARMQDEPIVLAPQPLEPAAPAVPAVVHAANGARGGRWSWIAPSAVAAGFVAVTGAVLLTRGPGAPVDASVGASSLAQVTPAAPPLTAVSTLPSEPPAQIASGKLIRDARLDRYLAAHKQFAGSSALGVPSGFLRNATAIESER